MNTQNEKQTSGLEIRLPKEGEKAVHGHNAGCYIYRRKGVYRENNIYGGADGRLSATDAMKTIQSWSEASISAGKPLYYTQCAK